MRRLPISCATSLTRATVALSSVSGIVKNCGAWGSIAPPITLDGFLWDALSGNRSLETLLNAHAERIAFAFCGHTHRERENSLGSIRGYNIGGDYHFKRLLRLDWPAGHVEAHTFGNPEQS